MHKCFYFYIFLFLTIFFIEGYSEPLPEGVDKIKNLPDLQITELVLKNGMRVILKPTKFEDNEILIRMTALGGFSVLNADQRASGELAAPTAWESGLGKMTTDQLSAMLYNYSLEFNSKITPFSRVLEGTCEEQGLEHLLLIINLYFTQAKFTEEAFAVVKKQLKEGIRVKAADKNSTYEENFNSINTSGYPYLQPVTIPQLDTADYQLSKLFFEKSFGKPDEFVCVIVGDFNVENVIPIIGLKLGSIIGKDVKMPSSLNNQIIKPEFPAEIVTKKVSMPGRTDSLARLTFPLSETLAPDQLHNFEVVCEVIEERLRETFRQRMKSSFGIDVGYELPFYPLLGCPWVTIQFRSIPAQIEHVKTIILDELKKIENEGPTQLELDKVLFNLKRADEYWTRENTFWIATLSNYSIWGWDPKQAIKDFNQISRLKPEDIKKMIQVYLPLKRYTLIYTQP